MNYKNNKQFQDSIKKEKLIEMVIEFTTMLKETAEIYGFTDRESIPINEVFTVIYNMANDYMYINDLMLEVVYNSKEK